MANNFQFNMKCNVLSFGISVMAVSITVVQGTMHVQRTGAKTYTGLHIISNLGCF